jgi:phytoene desaturase
MKDVVVIGAGIGGLASAIRMAAKGYNVQLFEANSYPGGKLSEFVIDGFRFDAGPSLFTMPEFVDELFYLSGEDPRKYFNYDHLDDICRYFYGDGTVLTATRDHEIFAREAAVKTGIDQEKIHAHLSKSRYIYKVTAKLFLQQSLHKLRTYLSLSTLWSFVQIPFLNIFTTMNKANERALNKNAHMVQLFNRYATYNGSNPYKAPGILNIIPHLEFDKGAFFPKGGMHSITRSLTDLALRKGVQLNFNSKVDKIRVDKNKATGVELEGRFYPADIVVCNMDVVPVYRRLMSDQKQPEKILRQERSSSALIFYWGIKREFPELRVHNIFFSEDYRAEFNEIFNEGSIYSDPTVYIHISSKAEPGDAPKGMENWFVMINVPSNKGQDWDSLIAIAKNNILSKLNKMLNVDVADLIVCEDILDPRRIESRTQSFQGALYGTASNSRMAAFFRHPNFSRKIKDLYFCVGSVHPGGGIPLALSSAKIIDSLVKS